MLETDSPRELRNTSLFAAATLHALARREHAGAPPRLTEPGHTSWNAFRGRLGPRHFVRLLLQDAAVNQGRPYDPALLDADIDLEHIQDSHATAWLDQLRSMDLGTPSDEYIAQQARALGLPSRFSRSSLHQVKAHHRVIELPGTGGQIAHHLVSTQDQVTLQDNLTVCTGGWQEELLAGLVTVELGVLSNDHIHPDPNLARAREALRSDADYVMGLGPDRGGAFDEVRLQTLFPNARIVLI